MRRERINPKKQQLHKTPFPLNVSDTHRNGRRVPTACSAGAEGWQALGFRNTGEGLTRVLARFIASSFSEVNLVARGKTRELFCFKKRKRVKEKKKEKRKKPL